MTYRKPEIEVLGDAAQLIEGNKMSAGDNGDFSVQITLGEEISD